MKKLSISLSHRTVWVVLLMVSAFAFFVISFGAGFGASPLERVNAFKAAFQLSAPLSPLAVWVRSFHGSLPPLVFPGIALIFGVVFVRFLQLKKLWAAYASVPAFILCLAFAGGSWVLLAGKYLAPSSAGLFFAGFFKTLYLGMILLLHLVNGLIGFLVYLVPLLALFMGLLYFVEDRDWAKSLAARVLKISALTVLFYFFLSFVFGGLTSLVRWTFTLVFPAWLGGLFFFILFALALVLFLDEIKILSLDPVRRFFKNLFSRFSRKEEADSPQEAAVLPES